jgi:hypothetical protein
MPGGGCSSSSLVLGVQEPARKWSLVWQRMSTQVSMTSLRKERKFGLFELVRDLQRFKFDIDADAPSNILDGARGP